MLSVPHICVSFLGDICFFVFGFFPLLVNSSFLQKNRTRSAQTWKQIRKSLPHSKQLTLTEDINHFTYRSYILSLCCIAGLSIISCLSVAGLSSQQAALAAQGAALAQQVSPTQHHHHTTTPITIHTTTHHHNTLPHTNYTNTTPITSQTTTHHTTAGASYSPPPHHHSYHHHTILSP